MSTGESRAQEQLAERIVDALFRNAFGEQARRLALKDDQERDLGGRNRQAARDEVLRVLREVHP